MDPDIGFITADRAPLIVVLLCGGDKGTQARDILTARKYWKEYLNAKPAKAEE
jgi:putative component of toxin-antitoxin plasmid stabilization module